MGSLIWNLSFRLPTVSLESVLHVNLLTPTSRARERPARMASYSAGLFDVLVISALEVWLSCVAEGLDQFVVLRRGYGSGLR